MRSWSLFTGARSGGTFPVLVGFCRDRAQSFRPASMHALLRFPKLKKSEKLLTKQVNMFMKLFRSDDKFSQMLTQLESQPEYGGGSGSGGCGDDETGDDEDGDEDGEDEDDNKESFDPIIQTPKNSDDEGNNDGNLCLNVGSEEGQDAEDDEDELYRDVNINMVGRDVQMTDVHTTQEFKDTHETLTLIIKEKVKVQVSKNLPKIKKTMNEQLEDEVITQSSSSSKTSYAVAADLSEMELKNILIEKIESNKSIHRSDEQRNLYKALVDTYESDKIILDTYEDIVMRRREGKEPESTSGPKEKATKITGKSTQGSESQQKTTSEFAPAEEPIQTTQDLEEPSHQEFETGTADDQLIAEAS
nr:hypothetical protein [Tanacetum cinerariifolium]